jgi:NhaA family Na+:H+ antiporter
MAEYGSPASDRLPKEPVDRLKRIVNRFLHIEVASGFLLLFVTVLAIVLANSVYSEAFLNFWKTPIGFRIGSFEIVHSLKHWINDGLMTLFFFVIGLEVKREIVLGQLSDLKSATLPIVAALGGMVAPAGIYLALQLGQAGERGWGIPMATDIAFVVGCMVVVGSRVPQGLRILLLSLAIADDIGAILVIALGYSSNLNLEALSWGFVGIAFVVFLARIGVRAVPIYFLVGSMVWFAFHESGVHPTIAGVVLGMLTPATVWVSGTRLEAIVSDLQNHLRSSSSDGTSKDTDLIRSVELAARENISPLERLETMLHPWVSFVIMPIFALANAGVPLNLSDFKEPVATAVMAGLILGKPTGIVLFSWLAISTGIARLPKGVTWPILGAGGLLAGIGFTMAIFIAGLALKDELLNASKVGILAASSVCALLGVGLLFWLIPKHNPDSAQTN